MLLYDHAHIMSALIKGEFALARITAEQKDVIRKSIIEKSRTLFLTHGYENTSTRMIAEAVGIANGTLFNYFETKGEIFLTVLSEGYLKKEEMNLPPEVADKNSLEIVNEFCVKNMKIYLQMPKGILRETILLIISNMSKGNQLLLKIMNLDFEFIEELDGLIKMLIEQKLLSACNTRYLSESIYSSLMYDYLLFVFNKKITKEDYLQKVKEKIEFLLQPYCINKNELA